MRRSALVLGIIEIYNETKFHDTLSTRTRQPQSHDRFNIYVDIELDGAYASLIESIPCSYIFQTVHSG